MKLVFGIMESVFGITESVIISIWNNQYLESWNQYLESWNQYLESWNQNFSQLLSQYKLFFFLTAGKGVTV